MGWMQAVRMTMLGLACGLCVLLVAIAVVQDRRARKRAKGALPDRSRP